MRGMRELSSTSTILARVGARSAGAAAACALAVACGQTPATPSTVSTATFATAGAISAGGTSLSWQDFAARGRNCRTPNNGPVTVCSPPNQPLPVVAIPPAQPPEDRPETLLLKRWRNGEFEANVLLIRPEIYNGQPCSSTGQAYTYVGVLGYFECAHMVGS